MRQVSPLAGLLHTNANTLHLHQPGGESFVPRLDSPEEKGPQHSGELGFCFVGGAAGDRDGFRSQPTSLPLHGGWQSLWGRRIVGLQVVVSREMVDNRLIAVFDSEEQDEHLQCGLFVFVPRAMEYVFPDGVRQRTNVLCLYVGRSADEAWNGGSGIIPRGVENSIF